MIKQLVARYPLILALILLLVGLKVLGYYQVTSRSTPVVTLHPRIKKNSIGKITVKNASALVKFTRLSLGTWIIETSEGQRAYEVATEPINQLLFFLSTPYKASYVESTTNPHRLSLYGLSADKRVTVTIQPMNGIDDYSTLILGSYSPHGDDLYIYHNNTIYRAPLSNFYSMVNSINSWIGVEDRSPL